MADADNTMCVVYMATNTINGKRYVGVTNKGLAGRKAAHLSKASRRERGCPRFYDAIRKHGSDAFEWQVLSAWDTFIDACEEEIRVIAELRPEYNIARGGWLGCAVAANRRSVICLEDGRVYESIHAAAEAYDGSVSCISECCRFDRPTAAGGRHFAFYSRKLTKKERIDTIRRLELHFANRRSALRRNGPRVANWNTVQDGMDSAGRRATGPMRNAKPVICLNDKKQYPSASAAAQRYNVSRSALIEMCLGKNGRKQVSGYKFAYVSVG